MLQDVVEQRTGQQLLFRLVCQACSLDKSGGSLHGGEVGRAAQDPNQKPWAQVAVSVWCALATATKASARRIYIRIAQSLSWQVLLWGPTDATRFNSEHVLGELNGRLMRCVDAAEKDRTNLRMIAQILIELLWFPTQQLQQRQRQQQQQQQQSSPPRQNRTGATDKSPVPAAGSTLASATILRLFISGEVVISQGLARLVDHRILMHICRSCKGEMECDDVRMAAFLLLRDCIMFQPADASPPAAAADASSDRGELDLRVELCLLCQEMLLSEDSSRDKACESEGNFPAISAGAASAGINWSRSCGRRLWQLVGQTLLDLLLLLERGAYWEHMGTVVAHAQLRNDLSLLSEPYKTAQEMLRLRQPHRDNRETERQRDTQRDRETQRESSAPPLSPVASAAARN